MEDNSLFEIKEDPRQSRAYGKYMESIGWKTISVPSPYPQAVNIQIFVKKLGPVSFAKIQRTKGKLPMSKIGKILKTNRVVMCKIEPLDTEAVGTLTANGYKLSREPLLGSKTLRVNLKSNQQDIFNSFKKDCRYILRKLEVRDSDIKNDDWDGFYEIWKKSAKRKSLWIPSWGEYSQLVNSFGGDCFSITIKAAAGAVVLVNKKTAFYYYAGSTKQGTRQNLPYAVVWESIKQAKKRGCVLFDFEGIYDKRWPNKSWKGFSHFKKSFGGKEILFPGSYSKWLWPG